MAARSCLAAQQMDSARTFVLAGDDRIVGYFSLTMGSVLRADAPAKLVRGLPAYLVGMVLVARLAFHRNEQGRGIGALLLAEPLRAMQEVCDELARRRGVLSDTLWNRAESRGRPNCLVHTKIPRERRKSPILQPAQQTIFNSPLKLPLALTILDRFRLRAWSYGYTQCVVRTQSIAAGRFEIER